MCQFGRDRLIDESSFNVFQKIFFLELELFLETKKWRVRTIILIGWLEIVN